MKDTRLSIKEIPYEVRLQAVQYTKHPVYAIRVGTNWYLFRPLTYQEFKQFQRAALILQENECDVFLADKYVLYPSLDKMPLRHMRHIGLSIIKHSGFGDPKDVLDAIAAQRLESNQLHGAVDLLIKTYIPGIDDDKLDAMYFNERMRYIVFAEKLSGNQIPLEPEKPKKRNKALKDLPISADGLENFIYGETSEHILGVNPEGHADAGAPSRMNEVESYSVVNTRLSKRK